MRVALVLPSGHFFNTPCVPNLARVLAEHGCCVDVYLARNTAVPTGSLCHDNLRLFWFPIVQKRARERVALLSLGFFVWLVSRMFREKYDYIIASGVRALFVVGLLSLLFRFPYLYNSLEIYSGSRFNTIPGRIFKRLESYLNRRAVLTIIQDQKRAEILRYVNGLDGREILQFPNAPFRVNSPRDGSEQKDIRLRVLRRFNIPESQRILIYSGSLEAEWSGFRAIMGIAAELPKGWVLFLQHRMRPDLQTSQDFEGLVKEGRIVVSTTPLSAGEYDDLVAAADIGLAWYESEDENIRHVGLSSGKIAHYFSHGKPVIVNSLPMYDEMFTQHGCGELVCDVREIPAAVEVIAQNYGGYSEGSRRVYESVYDMHGYAREIAAFLKQNVGESPGASQRNVPV